MGYNSELLLLDIVTLTDFSFLFTSVQGMQFSPVQYGVASICRSDGQLASDQPKFWVFHVQYRAYQAISSVNQTVL